MAQDQPWQRQAVHNELNRVQVADLYRYPTLHYDFHRRQFGTPRHDQGQQTSYAASENHQACRRPSPDSIAANVSRRARHLYLCPRHAQPLPMAS
jgi:hypothetical protein